MACTPTLSLSKSRLVGYAVQILHRTRHSQSLERMFDLKMMSKHRVAAAGEASSAYRLNPVQYRLHRAASLGVFSLPTSVSSFFTLSRRTRMLSTHTPTSIYVRPRAVASAHWTWTRSSLRPKKEVLCATHLTLPRATLDYAPQNLRHSRLSVTRCFIRRICAFHQPWQYRTALTVAPSHYRTASW